MVAPTGLAGARHGATEDRNAFEKGQILRGVYPERSRRAPQHNNEGAQNGSAARVTSTRKYLLSRTI